MMHSQRKQTCSLHFAHAQYHFNCTRACDKPASGLMASSVPISRWHAASSLIAAGSSCIDDCVFVSTSSGRMRYTFCGEVSRDCCVGRLACDDERDDAGTRLSQHCASQSPSAWTHLLQEFVQARGDITIE
jgi:hypothetical protein